MLANHFNEANSPLHSLKSSPGFITNEDIKRIRDYIPVIGQEQKRLDDEIAQLKAQIEVLERKKAGLERFEALHLAQISPVRRCPPEIISQIMLWCTVIYREQYPQPSYAPLVFLTVSRAWRGIALSEPRLWTTITCDISAHNALPLWETWLPRSRELPLVVRLRQSRPGCSWSPCEVMQTLFTTSHRWVHLDTTINSQMLAEAALQFPRLNSLVLDTQRQYQDAFRLAPQIKYVVSSMSIHQLYLPYHNITKWQFGKAEVRMVRELLVNAPNLKALHCTSLVSPGNETDPIPLMEPHPRLQKLAVTCPKPRDLAALLSFAVLPELRWISLTQLERSAALVPEFRDFLQRCGKQITYLNLEISCFGSIFPHCLEYLPNVVDLQLGCWSLSKPSLNDELLSSLSVSPERKLDGDGIKPAVIPLPKLQNLWLRGVFAFSAEKMMLMAYSRTGEQAQLVGVQALQSLKLQMENPFSALNPDTYPELKSLGASGLTVWFSFGVQTLWGVYGRKSVSGQVD